MVECELHEFVYQYRLEEITRTCLSKQSILVDLTFVNIWLAWKVLVYISKSRIQAFFNNHQPDIKTSKLSYFEYLIKIVCVNAGRIPICDSTGCPYSKLVISQAAQAVYFFDDSNRAFHLLFELIQLRQRALF